ncbi:hypothetical protein Leryth_023695 [Lithospermum erythrorhizon]|nr:hypothetical protein Leryth_023695 [Lithospermum erythrorhizon]
MVASPHANHAEEVFQAIVSKYGSGNYKTIAEAVANAPNNSATRYAIKIKAGVYCENVVVAKEKQNLAFIGDGAHLTIINGNKCVDPGTDLYASATVDINGDHFIAKYITFNNSAGPGVQQAVALKNSANNSAFYMCNFNGYQDTLFVDQGYQFFRECKIYGSVDFIFGYAAVVFQNCNIFVHNNIYGETVITAQGKGSTYNQLPSGISIHRCHIQGAKDLDLTSGRKTFLGRPWHDCATVVFMESNLENIIDPQGWEPFTNQPITSTIVFGEYKNFGYGSILDKRVNWAKPGGSMTRLQAEKFTVRNLIQGNDWLSATGIPFDLDLGNE